MPELIVPGEEGKSKRVLRIHLSPEERKAFEDRFLKAYQKDLRIPGFRPGKVPRQVLLRYLGKKFEEALIRDLVQRRVKKHTEETGERPLGQIQITEISRGDDGSLDVVVEFEVLPAFHLPNLSRIEVEKRVFTVSDADVEAQLEALQAKYARLVEVDRPVREGDTVVAEMVETDEEGNETFRGQVRIAYSRDQLDPYLYDLMAGKSKGDELDYEYYQEEEGGEAKRRLQHYRIIKILERELPPLDDEFAKKHNYESLDQMRKDIREAIEREMERRVEEEYEWNIIRAIYDAVPFEIPPTWLKMQMDALRDAVEFPPEMPEDERKAQLRRLAEDLIKREIILVKVAEEFGLEPTREELERYLLEEAWERGEEPQKYRKKLRSKDDWDRFRYRARLRKAMEFLKENVKTNIVFL